MSLTETLCTILLTNRVSAVDHECRPGYKRRFVARKTERTKSDLSRFGHSLERRVINQLLIHRRVLRVGYTGSDNTRVNRVSADERRIGEGSIFRQRREIPFGGMVGS